MSDHGDSELIGEGERLTWQLRGSCRPGSEGNRRFEYSAYLDLFRERDRRHRTPVGESVLRSPDRLIDIAAST